MNCQIVIIILIFILLSYPISFECDCSPAAMKDDFSQSMHCVSMLSGATLLRQGDRSSVTAPDVEMFVMQPLSANKARGLKGDRCCMDDEKHTQMGSHEENRDLDFEFWALNGWLGPHQRWLLEGIGWLSGRSLDRLPFLRSFEVMACYKLEMSSTSCRTLEVSTESSSLVQSSEAHLSTGDTYHLSLARLSDEKGLVCFQHPGLAELVMF